MMAPTSVSSRLSARPTTPLPKSSISFSIASVRPSILATPSEISRTTPTFCLAAVVLTPAICASISSNILITIFIRSGSSVESRTKYHFTGALPSRRYQLKTFHQTFQPRLHAAIVNITANLDPQTTQQRRVLRERKIQPQPIKFSELVFDLSLNFWRHRRGAFDFRRATFHFQFHQPLEVRQNLDITARLDIGDFVHDLPNALLIQHTVHNGAAEHLFRFAPGLFGNFHFNDSRT